MLPNPTDCRLLSPDALAYFEGAIIDVRTPEAYSEAHISGSINHCVYQIDFLEMVPKAYPDRSTALLVYGDGDPYKADLAALGRLQKLGYTDVSILDGGLNKWLSESRPVEGSGQPRVSVLKAQRFALDPEQTKVRWVGRNLMNQHNGHIQAEDGFIEISPTGAPITGKVSVDMRQMTCHDLSDNALADMLIHHLASSDFFDVANHPQASFELDSAEQIANATYGMPNYSVNGRLSARGRTLDINLEALVEPIENGYVFQTVLNIDRTELGALYGSGRIFERLGMHLVNDLVSLDIAAYFKPYK